MCGIFGVTSALENQVPLLLDNLRYLAYRGYDSTGICLQHNGLKVYKTTGDVKHLNQEISTYYAKACIGHTRWATHGKQSVENAHPHLSAEHVSIVHNGIIQNFQKIKVGLEEEGYVFLSQTDSEVIAHLLFKLLKDHPPLVAIQRLETILEGRYAFIAQISTYQDKIFGLSCNLPLFIGKSENSHTIASDLIALKHCQTYSKAPNHKAFEISPDHCSEGLQFSPVPKLKCPIDFTDLNITFREICEQHHILRKLPTIPKLPRPKHILFIACGSSFHAAKIADYWLSSLGIHTTLEVASELKGRSLFPLEDSWVVAISQSGETADTLLCLQNILPQKHLHSIAITNTPTSSLAQLCKTIIPLNIGMERGVASTKAVTASMLVLYKLVQTLSTNEPIPKSMSLTIESLYHRPEITQYAHILSKYQHILCLGRHDLFPIAQECALKIKELAYIHAEALPMGELKHGPLALIDHKVFCIVFGNADCRSTQNCLSEIQARGGAVLRIGSGSLRTPEISIRAVLNHSYIIINIVGQLLAYHTAATLNRAIDQPRNLAKSVTVE